MGAGGPVGFDGAPGPHGDRGPPGQLGERGAVGDKGESLTDLPVIIRMCISFGNIQLEELV